MLVVEARHHVVGTGRDHDFNVNAKFELEWKGETEFCKKNVNPFSRAGDRVKNIRYNYKQDGSFEETFDVEQTVFPFVTITYHYRILTSPKAFKRID